MKNFASKIYRYVINPPSDEELTKSLEKYETEIPTLWLLGKTGAGKSSIVQRLTGESRVEIGNGFMPCTESSVYYDFPNEHPILRFLDTRGLGEAGYDASEDIKSLGASSHAVLVAMRLRDGEQSAVMHALRQIKHSVKHIGSSKIIVVHTGAEEVVDEHDRERARNQKQKAVEDIWKSQVSHCVVDFAELAEDQPLDDVGADELRTLISEKLPELYLWLHQAKDKTAEQSNFDRLSSEVLWYAGAAAATDAIPVVGLVTVPSIQGKMLHSLAQKYDIKWDRRSFSEFTAALGTGFALRYAVSLGGRQLMKLIPGYGQLAGAAAAVVISYASTYALGRAASYYLYQRKNNTPIDTDSLKSAYTEADSAAKETGRDMFRKDKK